MFSGKRVKVFGNPYTASVRITIVNGEAHIEDLIAKTKFSKEDVIEIEEEIMRLGHKYYISSSFDVKTNKRVIKRVDLCKTN